MNRLKDFKLFRRYSMRIQTSEKISEMMTPSPMAMPDEQLRTQNSISMQQEQPLTIIELFQSQGCNSCPPANSNLIDLVQKSNPTLDNVLLLTYHVTYWDYLGWPDTFGNRVYDQRQYDYVRQMKLRSAFTPQVIVNGRSSGVGSSKNDLARIMKEGGSGMGMPVQINVITDGEQMDDIVLSVSSQLQSCQMPLEIVLITFDSTKQDVSIGRGENRGCTLPHLNVVTGLHTVGSMQPGQREGVFVIQNSNDKPGVKTVCLVQEGIGGPVVGAIKIE